MTFKELKYNKLYYDKFSEYDTIRYKGMYNKQLAEFRVMRWTRQGHLLPTNNFIKLTEMEVKYLEEM